MSYPIVLLVAVVIIERVERCAATESTTTWLEVLICAPNRVVRPVLGRVVVFVPVTTFLNVAFYFVVLAWQDHVHQSNLRHLRNNLRKCLRGLEY